MNWNEFQEQIERLKKVYNTNQKDFYPSERTSFLWKRSKYISLKDLKNAIDESIANNAYAPMVNKILEVLQPAINEAARIERDRFIKSLESRDRCNLCKNVGIVSMFKKDFQKCAPTSFKCRCECGDKFYPTLERFNVDLLDDWIMYHKRQLPIKKGKINTKLLQELNAVIN
ncbi:hypothetical protein KAR91_40635 [Candidatus Pacearchaeota archaeon]|nr:hypothetical protein [Candidatus Pacearchaeota archaeon]